MTSKHELGERYKTAQSWMCTFASDFQYPHEYAVATRAMDSFRRLGVFSISGDAQKGVAAMNVLEREIEKIKSVWRAKRTPPWLR